MQNDTLIAGISAATLVAVGLVVFMVGKVLAGFVKYRREEKKAGRTLTHPEFGVLTFGFGSWDGVARRDGREIRFTVVGSESAPDEQLLERVKDFVARFPDFEGRALDALVNLDVRVRREDFSFYAVNFLWADRPNFCALEFALKGDEEAIWRVEFEGDVVTSTGRDD